MAERLLSRTQIGIESTRGTAVASTRVLGCDVKPIPKDRVWEAVKLADGRRSAVNAKRNDQLLVRDTLSFSNMYFQAFPAILQCSLDGTISPTEQTPSQSDYLWTVAPSFTAANDPDTLTIEMGDDVQAYEIEYCMFDNLKYAAEISQEGGASPVTGEFGYFGRQVTPTTFTASQSLHSGLELINAKLSRLYLDTTWAGIGGTEQTSLLRAFEVEIMAGNHEKFFGSANKYFTSHGEGEIGAMVTLTLEGSSSADSIFDLYQAGTERALRLDLVGSQIGTGVNYRTRLDLFGYFEEVVPLGGEARGNNLHVAIFRGKADSSGNFMAMDVITNHNAI